MNKKLLAIAVASAMTASVAQADVKLSGGLQAELASIGGDTGKTGLTMGDVTTQKGNMGSFGASWTDGDMFGKINLNTKIWGGAANGAAGIGTRDMYVGMKMGGGKVMLGTFSSAYKTTGGVKIDPFLSTGLQARSSGGGQSAGSGGYVTAIGYRAKMGALNVALDFAPEMVVCAGATACAGPSTSHLGLGVSMDAGPANVFVAIDDFKGATDGADNTANTADDDEKTSATKVGAKMKMGNMNLAVQVEMNQKAYNNSLEDNTIFASLSMPMGGMTLGAWVGINKDTSLAVGVKKALSKKSMAYAGFRSTGFGDGKSATGITAGLRTKF